METQTVKQRRSPTNNAKELRAAADAAVHKWTTAKDALSYTRRDLESAQGTELRLRREVDGPSLWEAKIRVIEQKRGVLAAEAAVVQARHEASVAVDAAELAEGGHGAFDAVAAREALRPLLQEVVRRRAAVDEAERILTSAAEEVLAHLGHVARRALARGGEGLPPVADNPFPALAHDIRTGTTLDLVHRFVSSPPPATPAPPDHAAELASLEADEQRLRKAIVHYGQAAERAAKERALEAKKAEHAEKERQKKIADDLEAGRAAYAAKKEAEIVGEAELAVARDELLRRSKGLA